MNVRPSIVCVAVALWLTTPAMGWGSHGHAIAAEVAESLLSAQARAAALELLGAKSLAAVSSVSDGRQWRVQHPETRRWHFVDIPIEADGYNAVRDCRNQCLVSAIEQFMRVLRDPQSPRVDRQEALIWLIHLIADAHQPLHCANAGDMGGNLTHIRFHDHAENLHVVWDRDLFDSRLNEWDNDLLRLKLTDREYAKLLLTRGIEKPEQGDAVLWVTESQKLAQKYAYDFEDAEIKVAYEQRSRRVVEEQLVRAGYRIAAEIEVALRKQPE